MNASTPPEFLSPIDVGINPPLRLPGSRWRWSLAAALAVWPQPYA